MLRADAGADRWLPPLFSAHQQGELRECTLVLTLTCPAPQGERDPHRTLGFPTATSETALHFPAIQKTDGGRPEIDSAEARRRGMWYLQWLWQPDCWDRVAWEQHTRVVDSKKKVVTALWDSKGCLSIDPPLAPNFQALV
jgi:hypothetical protein